MCIKDNLEDLIETGDREPHNSQLKIHLEFEKKNAKYLLRNF